MPTRRHFPGTAATGLVGVALAPRLRAASVSREVRGDTYARLDAAAGKSVIDVSRRREPLIIETIEFLKNGETHLVRVRAKNGAAGVAVGNERDMSCLVPVAKQLMVPPLLGKDARDWENLIEAVYLHTSNDKRQGLLFWLPFAADRVRRARPVVARGRRFRVHAARRPARPHSRSLPRPRGSPSPRRGKRRPHARHARSLQDSCRIFFGRSDRPNEQEYPGWSAVAGVKFEF